MPFESTAQNTHSHAHSSSCDLTSLTSPSTKIFSPNTKALFTNLPRSLRNITGHSKPTAQDIVARIVAKDQALATAYIQPNGVTVTQTKTVSSCGGTATTAVTGGRSPLRQVPERIDSHRALTSSRCVVTTTSAPTTANAANAASKTVCAAAIAAPVSAPKATNAVQYFNKSLPPTPRRSSPLNPNFKANNAHANATAFANATAAAFASNGSNMSKVVTVGNVVKPLDIETCRRTLAAKRLSRRAHCNRSIPAPIFLPPLPLLAPQAIQEASPQTRPQQQPKDQRRTHTTTLLLEEIRIHDQDNDSMEITPLDVTPLDIPVDWDDLRDRWTSPVEKTAAIQVGPLGNMPTFTMAVNLFEDDLIADDEVEDRASEVLNAFQQDVTKLFATSPSLHVNPFRASSAMEIDLSSGSSASGDDGEEQEDHDDDEDFDVQSSLNLDLYCDFPEPPPLTAELSRNIKRHARLVSLEDLELDNLCISPGPMPMPTPTPGPERKVESAVVQQERQQSQSLAVEETEEAAGEETAQMSDSHVRRDSCVLPASPSPRNLCTPCAPSPPSLSVSTAKAKTELGRLITDFGSDSHCGGAKGSTGIVPAIRHDGRFKGPEPKKGESFLSMFSPMSPLQTGTIDIEFD